jgi:DNA-directed RNA polymerase specialized sigma24 family protein
VSRSEVVIRALLEEHGAALTAYAARLTGDPGGADVVAQVLRRAWPDPRASSRAYLFELVRRVVAERRGDPAGAHEVDSAALLDALRALPAEQREVLYAVYFNGRDVASTAADLGVPESAVKVRASAALRRLREAAG